MERKLHLIPYQVNAEVESVYEVPKGIELIAAPKIWEKSKGKGITVAILDTGCDVTHPDLSERIIGGRNFTGDDNGNPDVYTDFNGHGTHVAGTIAAVHNDTGVVGVAPEASLLIIKVLDKNGSGQYDWIINGINYAVEQKADIISMSLGGSEDVSELHHAIQNAIAKQILVVCTAGNEGDGLDSSDELAYPACYNEVISVGAINLQHDSSEFSNSNNEVDLVAPGEEILSTHLNGKYAKLSGTSMATPHISGALALIKEIANKNFERNLTEPELYAQLIKRTVPLGNSPKLEGNGLLYLTAEDYLSDVFNQKLSGVENIMEKLELLNSEWETAKSDFLKYKENRPYYDEKNDKEVRNQYYQSISFTDANLSDSLHTLLKKTHTDQLNYSPHRYVYPWVDLQENGSLKSLYSGKGMNPLSVIEEDIRLHELQAKGLIDSLSEDLLNCEHVVPQSWFDKKEPMRGDLHHLFACEPTCNSSRSNHPYYDFPDYVPEGEGWILGIKDGCGKAEESKFEPEYGKGIVARATLYFLIRYPNTIKKELENVSLLLKWHQTFPVSIYEKHRNLAIHELQGNRNPFIDFPEMAESIVTIEK